LGGLRLAVFVGLMFRTGNKLKLKGVNKRTVLSKSRMFGNNRTRNGLKVQELILIEQDI
jgi:hypothetical protein